MTTEAGVKAVQSGYAFVAVGIDTAMLAAAGRAIVTEFGRIGELAGTRRHGGCAHGDSARHESGDGMSAKKSINDFMQMKQHGEKITWLTGYDYPTATFEEQAGVDMILSVTRSACASTATPARCRSP